ncbi:MAG: hypothetical protein H8F28_02710 [Fibrella sp.]|nr:hypothetical protein [Armatimonadota bacterium]
MPELASRAPILYISDISADRFDAADLFDLAFLLHLHAKLTLTGIVLSEGDEGGIRALDSLAVRSPNADNIAYFVGANGLEEALRTVSEPVNIVAVANFALLATVLRADRTLFREKVARLFLVGGHANDYTIVRAEGERLPIDPRLKDRHPERFASSGDLRFTGIESRPALRDAGLSGSLSEPVAFSELLTSGEGVIWLPRDICLWRYAAPQTLSDGGAVCEWLLRELFWANLQAGMDRFTAGDAPVLLSALPALLLATQPDPLGWLRLFRAVTARVETNAETGRIANIAVKHERPNLYAVVGIDGRALGEVVTKTLRVRPLMS